MKFLFILVHFVHSYMLVLYSIVHSCRFENNTGLFLIIFVYFCSFLSILETRPFLDFPEISRHNFFLKPKTFDLRQILSFLGFEFENARTLFFANLASSRKLLCFDTTYDADAVKEPACSSIPK